MYFSDVFDISSPASQEWFDPILHTDTKLFVDPFLIFSDDDPEWASAHDTIIGYFEDAFMLLAESGLNPAHLKYGKVLSLMESPEPKELRLGYTGKGSDGSGTGKGIAKLVVKAMAKAIERGLQDIRHFEELGVLVPGIDRDRISDLTCNILKPRLIAYTQEVCRQHGVPLTSAVVRRSEFRTGQRTWFNKNHDVPLDPATGRPILLVPKRFLRVLPTLSAFDWYEYAIRRDMDLAIMDGVDKRKIVKLALQNTNLVRSWSEDSTARRSSPYPVSLDPDGFVRWDGAGRAAAQSDPIVGTTINSQEDLLAFVVEVMAKVRHLVEYKKIWRLFWNSVTRDAIPEEHMQLLIFCIIVSYCEAAGVRVDRGVETGRGPVDFIFTRNYHVRVAMEIKRLTNSKVMTGLDYQLPEYMIADGTDMGIFLIVRDSTSKAMNRRWAALRDLGASLTKKAGLTIAVERIDPTPKPGASKGPSR